MLVLFYIATTNIIIINQLTLIRHNIYDNHYLLKIIFQEKIKESFLFCTFADNKLKKNIKMNTFDVYPLFDIEITKGNLCNTYDKQGNEYLDL